MRTLNKLLLNKSFSLSRENPRIACELVRHPRGRFSINGRTYRPTWPVAITEESELGLAKEIVSLGIREAQNIYDGEQSSPSSVRIELYGDGRTRIIVVD